MTNNEKVREKKTVEVLCSMCGQSCHNSESGGFDFTVLDFSPTGSFGSKFDGLGVGEIDSRLYWHSIFEGQVRFCDTCTIKLLARLKILPPACEDEGLIPGEDGDWQE